MFKQENASIISLGVLAADILVLIFAVIHIPADPSNSHSLAYRFFAPELTVEYSLKIVALIVLAACTYINTSLFLYKNRPLTVLRTDIEITINSTMDVAVFNRSQTLRANIPHVNAYFTKVNPTSPSGKCGNAEMTISSLGADYPNHAMELFGQEHTRGFEAIHTFGRSLRYRWFMVLLWPSLFDRKYENLPRFFRKNLSRRTQQWTYLNEFNCKKPKMDFTASDYAQHNIYISVNFEAGIPEKLKVQGITLHGVRDVPYTKERGGTQLLVNLERLYRETIRIYWENDVAALSEAAVANNPSITLIPAS